MPATIRSAEVAHGDETIKCQFHSDTWPSAPLASGGVHPGGRHAKHHPHRADLAAEEPPELVRVCGMCGQRQLRGTDEKGVC